MNDDFVHDVRTTPGEKHGRRAQSARELRPAALKLRDVVRVGAVGLRTRPMRAFLSALGIAIGIAAMVAVVGISSSSRAELDGQLDALGTNLLTVTPGTRLTGEQAQLPLAAESMVRRIPPVRAESAIGKVDDASVYRTNKIPDVQTNGIIAYAARTNLLDTIGATIRSGKWIDAATGSYPATVLGASAAERLGITKAGPDTQVLIGNQWFTVLGILEPAALAPELDSAALMGWPAAERVSPSTDTRPRSTPARTTPRYRRSDRSSEQRPTRRRRTRSRCRARPTHSPRSRPPARRSPDCCSASARSRCWSAASGSRTSW